jgi:hypothetical protein
MRPQKRKKHSPLRKLLSQLPSQSALSSAFMVENALTKLGFGLSQDLTIIGVSA